MPTVLVILPEGFEELEAVAPIDLLRRAGAEVTVAALSDGIHVTGRNGLTLHADTTLAAIGEKSYDALVLPGGPGVKHLRADEHGALHRAAGAVRRRAARHLCGAVWPCETG